MKTLGRQNAGFCRFRFLRSKQMITELDAITVLSREDQVASGQTC
jgi:hypothetical protein